MRSTGADKYDLQLPEYDDAADVEVLNDSTETIAATLKEVDDESAQNKADIAALQTELSGEGGVAAQVSGLQAAVSGEGGITSRLGAVESKATDNKTQLDSINAKAFTNTDSLKKQIEELKSALDTAKATIKKLDDQVNNGYNGSASILSRLGGLDSSVANAASAAERAQNTANTAQGNATGNVDTARIEGVVGVPNGGTGASSLVPHGLLVGNGTGAVKSLAGTGAVYQSGAGSDPVVGALPVNMGGTGASTQSALESLIKSKAGIKFDTIMRSGFKTDANFWLSWGETPTSKNPLDYDLIYVIYGPEIYMGYDAVGDYFDEWYATAVISNCAEYRAGNQAATIARRRFTLQFTANTAHNYFALKPKAHANIIEAVGGNQNLNTTYSFINRFEIYSNGWEISTGRVAIQTKNGYINLEQWVDSKNDLCRMYVYAIYGINLT